MHRVRKNYRRISLRHNLSRKCRKIVKFVSITHSERNIWNGPTVIVSTAQLGTSHKTCLWGFGGNWSIAWTSAVPHVGRTSNAFKVTMKLQTFLFQMVVTSCIYVQYLWKYGFAKSFYNLYAPCMICILHFLHFSTCTNPSRGSLCFVASRNEV